MGGDRIWGKILSPILSPTKGDGIMASKNDLIKTGTTGLYYREHPVNKIGKSKRKDRQWVIRQTLGGVTRASTLGWLGADKFSEGDALNKLT